MGEQVSEKLNEGRSWGPDVLPTKKQGNLKPFETFPSPFSILKF